VLLKSQGVVFVWLVGSNRGSVRHGGTHGSAPTKAAESMMVLEVLRAPAR